MTVPDENGQGHAGRGEEPLVPGRVVVVVEVGMPRGAAAMRAEAERPRVFLEKPVEDGCRLIGVLGGEDLSKQSGGFTHPGDAARVEVDGVGFSVGAEHVGDFGRVGPVVDECVDQSSGPPRCGEHGVPGRPVVAGGGHG